MCLKRAPGGMSTADYPNVFDAIEGDGITIEAWIYLIERPGDRAGESDSNGNWLIVDKPGSYYVTISGRDLNSPLPAYPKGTTAMAFGLLRQVRPGLDRSGSRAIIPPEEFPLARWVHIAFQIAGGKYNTRMIGFYDRIHKSAHTMGDVMGRTAAPLLIGGSKLVTFENGRQWGREYESMKGYIDEVRVSEGFRYARGAEIGSPKQVRMHCNDEQRAKWRRYDSPPSWKRRVFFEPVG